MTAFSAIARHGQTALGATSPLLPLSTHRKNPREYLEQSSKGCNFDAKDRFRPHAVVCRQSGEWPGKTDSVEKVPALSDPAT